MLPEYLGDQKLIASKAFGALKILSIDDDQDTAEVLKTVATTENHQIVVVDSSASSLETARQLAPDVIVIDMVSEEQCLGLLKHLRTFSDAPVLVLSVVDRPQVVARMLNEGADDYLIKPAKGAVLRAYLNKLARRHVGNHKNGRNFS
jgi:two-component system KDP operon response regulator KdpE